MPDERFSHCDRWSGEEADFAMLAFCNLLLDESRIAAQKSCWFYRAFVVIDARRKGCDETFSTLQIASILVRQRHVI
jgi:hypothetical protein